MHGKYRCYECLRTIVNIYWNDDVKQGTDEGHEAERQERIIWVLRTFVIQDPRLQLSEYADGILSQTRSLLRTP